MSDAIWSKFFGQPVAQPAPAPKRKRVSVVTKAAGEGLGAMRPEQTPGGGADGPAQVVCEGVCTEGPKREATRGTNGQTKVAGEGFATKGPKEVAVGSKQEADGANDEGKRQFEGAGSTGPKEVANKGALPGSVKGGAAGAMSGDGEGESKAADQGKPSRDNDAGEDVFAAVFGEEPGVGEFEIPGLRINPGVPQCCKCGGEVDPLRCAGKSPGTWKCRICNTRSVQLSRAFGSWPIPEYKALSEEAKRQFWADAKDCSSASKIAELVQRTMTSSVTNHEATVTEGEWLPLAVWAHRGWDTAQIVATATKHNSKPDARWGTLYKVCVERDSRGARRENSRSEALSSSWRPNDKKAETVAARALLSAEDDPKAAIAQDDASESSDNESDSSSSTSRGKSKKEKKSKKSKSKKEKKSKKDKKAAKQAKEAREKEERRREELRRQKQEQAIEQKAKAAALRDANRALAKLSPVHSTLSVSLGSELLQFAPTFAVERATAAQRKMEHIIKVATAVVQKQSGSFPHDLNEVAAAATEAAQATRLLQGLLLTVTRHAGN